MKFPDLPHLRKLSRALWSGDLAGNAAVMVGAGVSANARPADPDYGKFPTWGELTDTMVAELSEASQSSSQFPKSFPRIASEYEAAFGPKALHDLISESIPDLKFLPSVIHEKLLGLPWVDIFTTNYDTLLERTFVQGRSFHTVTKVADIARGSSPRIYKLHGSLPSETPLIITEEHFRTYPVKYAPFVNTVRQSMLENAFVLLGFSGDDPNFLEWSGWVRDQLGPEHCPIYLCGLLNLDAPRRRLLEMRGVTPIDLSPLFGEAKDRPDGHKIALDWFLEELSRCEPPRPTNWPSIDVAFREDPERLSLVATIQKEQTPEKPKPHLKFNDDKLQAIYRRWFVERERFPGWVVAPKEARMKVWDEMSHYIFAVFSTTSKWSIEARLLIFHELNWRLEICHCPLVDDWMKQIETVVTDMKERLSGSSRFDAPELKLSHLSRYTLEHAMDDLWLSLLRDARESYDFARWETLFEKVAPNAATSVAIAYEELLCLLFQGLRQKTRERIEQFPECRSACDRLKKAAILAELDSIRDARREAERALLDVRQALSTDPENIHLLSLEGWALFQLLHNREPGSFADFKEFNRLTWKRFRELRLYDCDPISIKSELEETLRGIVPEIGETEVTNFRFDPLAKSKSHRFVSDRLKQFIPAFAYIRLFEKGAIPLRLPVFGTAGTEFHSALEWKYSVSSRWSHLLMIRRGNCNPLKEELVLTRNEVALMSQENIDEIFETCRSAFDSLTASCAGRMFAGDLEVMAVSVEILSRISLRIDETKLKESFSFCCKLYESRVVATNRNLEEACSNWFKRLLLSASNPLAKTWIVKILKLAPFAGPPSARDAEYPHSNDPFFFVPISLLESLNLEDPTISEIQLEIENHFHQLKIETGKSFLRALGRLVKLRCANSLFDKKQDAALADWVWFENGEVRKTPLTPGFDPSVTFFLPSPEGLDPTARWKKTITKRLNAVSARVAAGNEIDLEEVRDLFQTITRSTKDFRAMQSDLTRHICWNKTESKRLLLTILDLWGALLPVVKETEKKRRGTLIFHFDFQTEFCRDVTALLADAILPSVGKLSDCDLDRVDDLLRDISKLGEETIEAELSLARLKPDLLTSIEDKIAESLRSETNLNYSEAVSGLRRWGEISKNFPGYSPPPPSFVDQIVENFAFRVSLDTEASFGFLSACISRELGLLSQKNIDMIVCSFRGWEISTRPGNRATSRKAMLDDRYRLSMLADHLLKIEVLSSDKNLCEVSKKLARDPLPEVRNAFSVKAL